MGSKFLNISLVLTVVVFLTLGFIFTSCSYPTDNITQALTSLRSEIEDDDNDDNDDNRRGLCEDRDSCQDICDTMFRSVSSRDNCYEERNRNVDILQEVYDTLSQSISKGELEDLDPEDFGFFLSMNDGGDDFIDIIQGNHKHPSRDSSTEYSKSDSKIVLEWIARNEDAASEIASYDSNNEVLFALMEQYADGSGNPGPGSSLYNSGLSIFFISAFAGLSGDGYGNGSDEAFVIYAGSRNEESIELAHAALAAACRDAENEDNVEDEDVKKCMLAVYCSISGDFPNFFDDDPIHIGDNKSTACHADTFANDDKVDRYF